MCDPATIAIGAQVAGGLLGAGAEQQAGQANAAIESNNASIARYQAKDALRRGAIDEQQIKQRIAQIIGSQRAGNAAGGLALDSGTPLDLALDTERTGAIDVATARLNAANEALGYRQRAKALDYQSSLSKKSGTQAALGTLLGSGGDAFKTYKLAGT